MIELEWIWGLLLLPLPLLVYFFSPANKGTSDTLYMPAMTMSTSGSELEHTSAITNKLILMLLCLGWIFLVLSLSKPVKYGELVELPSTGRDLLLAVDISGSMQEQDMELNGKRVDRLILVKNVVDTFIQQRKGDRIGLILFGTNAYIQAPLTFDLTTVSKLLNESQIGFAGDGTAIGDAIGLSIKRLANTPAENRVLILLTDGRNTAGEVLPDQAAKLAAQESVKIYTIGIGSDKTVRRGLFGLGSYNPSRDLDEKTLKLIANITQGEYFRARNQQELAGIYSAIDQLEAIDQEPERFRPKTELFFWPLGIAMSFFMLSILCRRLIA